jgi:hypothetical protein
MRGIHQVQPADEPDTNLNTGVLEIKGRVRKISFKSFGAGRHRNRRAMQGPEMRITLQLLAENFHHYAVPKNGRYVKAPAIVADGTALPAALTFRATKK